MENEIYQILSQMIFRDKITELYEKRCKDIKYPLPVDYNNINIKVIIDFLNEYFDTYEYTLLINATVYAINNADKNYLNFIFKNFKKNFKDRIGEDEVFLIKTVEYGYKNIKNNLMGNKEFDDNQNKRTIELNKKIFDKIDSYYTEYQTITKLYRKYILDFLNDLDDDHQNKELYLNIFLTTTEFDNKFFFSTGYVINESNILSYKKILLSLIFADCFISINNFVNKEAEKLNNSEDEDIDFLETDMLDIGYGKNSEKIRFDNIELENNDEYDNDEEYEDESDIMMDEKDYDGHTLKMILEHILGCYHNDSYHLPSDLDLRFKMFIEFFTYNAGYNNIRSDIKTLEQNESKKLCLSSINPLYKYDLI